MSIILVTIETHDEDLRSGSWADFVVKLRDITEPFEFRVFTGTVGLGNNSNQCFTLEDIPELTNSDQIEYFEIRHNSQESFGQTADNWDATVHVNLLPPFALGLGGPHRFQGDNRNLRIFPLRRIALQAFNGQYVAAEGGGGRELVANRTEIRAWETFELNMLGDDVVALRAFDGHYVSAIGGGGGEILANGPSIRGWERFTLVDLGENRVGLQAPNGQYVAAEGGGGRELVANRTEVREWETFTLVEV